tara:strand:- start:1889 stop:3154 length:1266 start_codon:yes stop_codon:yes gene_type:complete
MKFLKILFILIFLISKGLSQNQNKIQINLFGNDNYTHFLNNNKNGIYSPNKVKSNIIFKNTYINDNFTNLNFHLNWMLNKNGLKILEFHSKYSNKIMNVKVGSFSNEKLYDSPIYSSGSMVFSNNAEKIPGIAINSNWINIYRLFEIKAELFQGKFPKQTGYKGGPYLHYKSLLLKRSFNDLSLGFSIQHAVQHGGYDQNNKKIPNTFENYINVFFARSGDESQPGQDQAYKAGNGLGAFTLFMQKNNLKLYFEHYFDDKSGVKTLNFGDGLLGIEYLSKNIILNVELIDTTDQSGNRHPPGVDSYYYHDVYKFGWSNNGLTIGNSFISPFSNRKIIYNSNIKLNIKNTSLILQYADSKIFVPYLSKNNNLPYENHNDVLEKNNFLMLGFEKKISLNRMLMVSYAKEKNRSNFVLSYLIEL